MNKFTAKDGSPQQSLSIVQREFSLSSCFSSCSSFFPLTLDLGLFLVFDTFDLEWAWVWGLMGLRVTVRGLAGMWIRVL